MERRVFARILFDIFLPGFVTADTEFGIEVGTLSGEDRVKLKVGRFVLEVPFPNHGGVVSGLAEFNGEGLFARRHPAGEVKCAVGVVVFPGQDTSAGRGADRVGAKGIFKKSAFLGEAVDGGRGSDLGEPTAVGGNPVSCVVIRHDVKDVGLGIVLFFVMTRDSGARKQGKEREKFE